MVLVNSLTTNSVIMILMTSIEQVVVGKNYERTALKPENGSGFLFLFLEILLAK